MLGDRQLSPRFVALDGVRGIAAVSVVFYHMKWAIWFQSFGILRHGAQAVDMFFILSGFVITSAYVRKFRDIRHISEFLILRFFRIMPLHWFVLAVLLLFELIKLRIEIYSPTNNAAFAGQMSFGHFVETVVLAQAFGVRTGWNPPSWSISCEAVVYLLFAGLAWGLLGHLGRRKTMICAAAMALGGLALYLGLATKFGALDDITFEYGILRAIGGFLIGSALNIVYSGKQTSATAAATSSVHWLSLAQIALVTFLLVLASYLYDEYPGAATFLSILVFIGLISTLASDRGVIARLLISKPIQTLGQLSYSIYLIHYGVLLVVVGVLKRFPIIDVKSNVSLSEAGYGDLILNTAVALGVVLLVVVAAKFSFELVEQPGRRLGRRLTRQRPLPFGQTPVGAP